MQMAYANANQIIVRKPAAGSGNYRQCSDEANSVRQGSIDYTDNMLQSLQAIINHSIEEAQGRFDSFRAPCRKAMILSPITAMSCPEVFLLRQRSLYREEEQQ